MKMFLDNDVTSGIAHWVDTDEATGITTYGVDQDVDVLVEENKVAYNADHGRWEHFTHVARVPTAIYAEWVREGRDKDDAFVKRWLNDPDNRFFRTRPGSI